MFADSGLSQRPKFRQEAPALHGDGIIRPGPQNIGRLEDKHLVTHGSVGVMQRTEGRVVFFHPIHPHFLHLGHPLADMLIEIAPLGVDHLLKHGDGHGTAQLAWKLLFLEEIHAASNLPHQLERQID